MSNFVALGCLKVGEMFSVGGHLVRIPHIQTYFKGAISFSEKITITLLTLLEGALSSKIRAICGL